MAEIQINQEEINRYSQEFARRLSDYYFIDHTFIDGKDILNFCDIKQVNLLIVKNLFEKWKVETTKLKSPYFDYEHAEVRKAMQHFLNILSQHIRIAKNHFYPLLSEATRETLLLILNPYQFYQEELRKPVYFPLKPQAFDSYQRYIQYNKELLKNFVSRLHQMGHEAYSSEQAQDIFEQAYHDSEQYIEPMEWRIKNFADIYAIEVNRLFISPQPVKPQMSAENTQRVEDPPVVNNALSNYEANREDEESDGRVLNDMFRKEQTTKANILDQFQKARIDNIRTAISLNQKFLFINKLFDGDSFAFNDAITKIEDCKSFDEARHVINNEFALRYNWNFDSEEVRDFYDIVEKRFS
ncbi:MAG: hypothetical protein HC880_01450 [Bacteroidia bacterium]|nr:hypothetical protein [Bacteroidia bacterium]